MPSRPESGAGAGRAALVIGAAGGMGRAVTRALAGRGIAVGAAGRDLAHLEQLSAECADGTVEPLHLDLTALDGIAAAAAQAVEKLGRLDYLIGCAGVHAAAKTQEADLASWDRMLDSNFRGFVHLVHHLLPELARSGSGAVVAIGSITSAYSGAAVHIAGKRALAGFCEALFEDVRDTGTKVCVISPGFVNTPMVRSDRLDRARMIQPEDVARTVIFILDMPPTCCPTEIVLRPQRSPYLTS